MGAHTWGRTPALLEQWAAAVQHPGAGGCSRCLAQGHLSRRGSGFELATLRLPFQILNQYATDAPLRRVLWRIGEKSSSNQPWINMLSSQFNVVSYSPWTGCSDGLITLCHYKVKAVMKYLKSIRPSSAVLLPPLPPPETHTHTHTYTHRQMHIHTHLHKQTTLNSP